MRETIRSLRWQEGVDAVSRGATIALVLLLPGLTPSLLEGGDRPPEGSAAATAEPAPDSTKPAAPRRTSKKPRRAANRLSRESSPYLLLHAHDPVDWYPWSPEAFEKAKAKNKPIFLSIGYSSCHWCHVMERLGLRE